jgi:hypothetical protein
MYYSNSYLDCPQLAESEGKEHVLRYCTTGSADFNSSTPQNVCYLQFILCFAIYASHKTEVVNQISSSTY